MSCYHARELPVAGYPTPLSSVTSYIRPREAQYEPWEKLRRPDVAASIGGPKEIAVVSGIVSSITPEALLDRSAAAAAQDTGGSLGRLRPSRGESRLDKRGLPQSPTVLDLDYRGIREIDKRREEARTLCPESRKVELPNMLTRVLEGRRHDDLAMGSRVVSGGPSDRDQRLNFMKANNLLGPREERQRYSAADCKSAPFDPKRKDTFVAHTPWIETPGKQSWHIHTSKTNVEDHTKAFMQRRRDVQPYVIDNENFYATVARLENMNPDKLIQNRKLDQITQPGFDPYTYTPLPDNMLTSLTVAQPKTYVESTRMAAVPHANVC